MSDSLQKETRFVSLELLDSRDAYENFYNSQEASSSSNPPPKVPFLRKPNDEKNNIWVYPFPQDIWDFWINRGIAPGPHVFDKQPDDYIEPPFDGITGGYQIQPFTVNDGKTSSVYPLKYRRLWDFIYNPEFFLMPSLQGPRRIPFPHYKSNGTFSVDGRLPSLIPPFLPDAIYPNHPSLPYSNWQYSISLDSISEEENDVLLEPSSVMAQKVAFIRAYGSKPIDVPEKYEFEPVNITNQENGVTPPLSGSSSIPYAIDLLNLEKQERYISVGNDRVVFYQPKRPDFSHLIVYPVLTTRSPMAYAPVIIHDANTYKSSGWYYFFRQKIRRSSSFPFPRENATYKQLVDARRLLRELQKKPETKVKNTTLLIEEVAMLVLSKQSSVYLNVGKYDPATKFYEPPNSSTLTPEQRAAYEVIVALKELIILSLNTSPHELVVDEFRNPVYEETPYKVVTVHVIRGQKIIDDAPLSVSFNYKKQITMSVPAFLNVSQPGYLDIERNNRDIDWIPQGHTASLVRVNLDRGSNHHVDISFSAPGEYFVLCKIRRGYSETTQSLLPNVITYLFKFLNYEFTFDVIHQLPTNPIPALYTVTATNIPFGDEASVVPLRFIMDKNHWYEHRFADPVLMSIVQEKRDPVEEIVNYLSRNHRAVLSTHFRKQESMGTIILSKYQQVFNQSPLSYRIYAIDPSRPFIFLRHSNNPYHAYLVVVVYTTAKIPVDFFGSTITLKTFLPVEECNTGKFYVTWSDARGHYLTEQREDGFYVRKTGPSVDLTVKHPRQLTTYFAHVHLYNDTCSQIPDDTPLYSISYAIFIDSMRVDPHRFLFQGLDLDENGNFIREITTFHERTMRVPESENDYPRPFFQEMCRVYALLYKIDLYNFALLYPFVIAYCEKMDFLLRNHDPEKRIVILGDLPKEMKGLAPSRIHPPYLFVKAKSSVTIYGEEPIYYVIFDPDGKRWINLVAVQNADTSVKDPRIVIPFEKEMEYLLDSIARYHPYVHINSHLFMTQNEISLKNKDMKPLSSQQQVPSLVHDPTTIPDISTFLLHIREAIERASGTFRQIHAKGSTETPVLQNKLINTLSHTTRQSFTKSDNDVLYQALYGGESGFMNYTRKASYFLRMIRQSLGEPILLREAESFEDQLQSRINVIIHQNKQQMSASEYMENRESFMSLYAGLRRIADADLGFLFLDHKYPFDYMFDGDQRFQPSYYLLNQLDAPLVTAFSISNNVDELMSAFLEHYLAFTSMRVEIPVRTALRRLEFSVLKLMFSWNISDSNDQKISSFITPERANPPSSFYMFWSQSQWTWSNQGSTRSFIQQRRITSVQSARLFKIYFTFMFDLLKRRTRLTLFESVLVLFIRTTGYFHKGEEDARPYLWNALTVYKEFKEAYASVYQLPTEPEDVDSFLAMRDAFLHTYRGKAASIWPFHLNEKVTIVARMEKNKEIAQKFAQETIPPPSQKEINAFKRNLAIYTIPEYAFVHNPTQSWDDFKSILWSLYPSQDFPLSKEQMEPVDSRYNSIVFDNTIVAEAYRYVLTFFQFSGDTLSKK
jgi:hypothetical protein